MQKIKLSNSSLVALVDEEDYKRVWFYSWRLCRMNRINYAYTEIDNKQIGLHVLIFGEKPNFVVDHLDNDGLNCCRFNLRHATKGQNTQRQLRKSVGSSKFRGVKWDKKNLKWIAAITVNYKYKNLGRFDTEIATARAYNIAAKTYFGKEAYINEF